MTLDGTKFYFTNDGAVGQLSEVLSEINVRKGQGKERKGVRDERTTKIIPR
jgi:hypothetical protein